MIFLFFPIGIFYLPETCLIYTQRHLATHSSDPDADTDPDLDPDAHWRPALYRITFGFHFEFGIGLRFGESSPAQFGFGVLHLPLTYFILRFYLHTRL